MEYTVFLDSTAKYDMTCYINWILYMLRAGYTVTIVNEERPSWSVVKLRRCEVCPNK